MKAKDIEGQKFGRLTAIKFVGSDKSGYARWECKCDCGKTVIVYGANLRSGRTKSCGCLYKYPKAHGGTGTRLYKTWCSMNERCYRAKDKSFPRYGGRGIRVCDEWRHNFEAFRDWALANGYNDSLSIDRIRVNGNYEPMNCRWSTDEVQANNKRSNRTLEYNGKLLTIAQWSKETGIPSSDIRARIFRLNWSIEAALSTPIGRAELA